MTPLVKPVHRRGMMPYRGRRIVASLLPGDVLGLRLERTRRTEFLSLAGCYERAVMIRINSERAAKKAAKKARKS